MRVLYVNRRVISEEIKRNYIRSIIVYIEDPGDPEIVTGTHEYK